MAKIKSKSFGSCAVAQMRPEMGIKSKVINVIVPFHEPLKLNLALDECLRKLNKYNLSTREGKRAAVNLVIHAYHKRIAVMEDKVSI